MCGRATLATPVPELREAFDLATAPEMPARYNIAPSQPIAVIRTPRRLELLRWGIRAEKGAPKINVRAETVGRAPMHRDAFWNRRCLVVVDGFYEWQLTEGGTKRPYFVRREDSAPFALAGIWNEDACAILTGAARGVLAEIHDRSPIIVPRAEYASWLDHTVRVDVGTDDEGLVAFPVSTLVNNPVNDSPECIAPATEATKGETLSLF